MNGDKPQQNANDYNQKSRENAQRFTVNRLGKQGDFGVNKTNQINLKKTHFAVKHWAVLTIIISSCLLTTGLVYALQTQITFPTNEPVLQFQPKPKPPKIFSSLSHLEVANQTIANQAVTAIMIENSPDARPQSGLKDAEIVFEAIAEGGITRFLCLYQINKPKLIGPVRSLREYYIDWLTPFQPSVAHVGGSAEALKIIRNGTYRDIDQFFNGKYYWRATDRYAPHNVYTNFIKLDSLNQSRGYISSTVENFSRQIVRHPKESEITTKNIDIKISGPLYNINYSYDFQTNSYKRQIGGKPHFDREKGQITPNAVIAIKTNMQRVFQDGYREQITTIGQEKAYIFQNGQVIEGIWRKPARDKQIRFYNNQNQEITINSGQVWITAIPNSSGQVSWN